MPKTDLSIKNFDNFLSMDDSIEDKPKNPLLPKHPSRIVIAGGSGKGKTNLLFNFIFKFLKYHRLYLYSTSLDQPKFNQLIAFFHELEERIADETGEQEQILFTGATEEEILPVEELDKSYRNLVVFDDLQTMHDPRVIESYFIKSRHKNATCIALYQNYFKCPRPIRLNATQLCLFGMDNRKEMSLLYQELGTDLDKDEFFSIFNEAVSKPFSFFYIDRSTKLRPARYRRNLDEILTI
jgi:hypothetical protein